MVFLLSATLFGAIAVVILAVIPRLSVSLWSVVAFVLGEYAGALGFSVVYTWLVATPSGELTSRAAVLGFFAGAFISAIVAGLLVAWLFSVVFARYSQHNVQPKA